LSDTDVDRLMTTLLREMECGLSRDPHQRKLTSLQMENTYVRSLLDGKGLSLLLMTLVVSSFIYPFNELLINELIYFCGHELTKEYNYSS